MPKQIYRSEMYYADLSPVIGSEQGGKRPVLIIQNNIGNLYSPTVIVAAMTGKVRRKAKLPTHYIVNGYGGLGEDSIILLEQIRTIDKRRLKKYIGKLLPAEMESVEKCMIISLGLKQYITKIKSEPAV